MDIKEILQQGGRVSFPYKEGKEEWMGNANILAFSGGYGLGAKIILEVPTAEIKGRKEFPIDQVDEAVVLFKKLVMNKKNLAYKMQLS